MKIILGKIDGECPEDPPIQTGSLRFYQPDGCDAVGCCQVCSKTGNSVRSRRIEEFETCDPLLCVKLLDDQLTRDAQRDSRRMRESLCSPEFGIRRTHWSGDC